MIPSSYRVEARSAPRPKTKGVCPGELATGGRALPERNEDHQIRTAHHRSVILFSRVRRLGENSFRGFFEPAGEGSRHWQLATQRKGRRVTCRPLRSVKDCVLCRRSCLTLPQNGDKASSKSNVTLSRSRCGFDLGDEVVKINTHPPECEPPQRGECQGGIGGGDSFPSALGRGIEMAKLMDSWGDFGAV